MNTRVLLGLKYCSFYLILTIGLFFGGCADNNHTEIQEKNLVQLDTLEGYFSFAGEQGYFVDCESKKLFELISDSIVNNLKLDYEDMDAVNFWIYGNAVFELIVENENTNLPLKNYSQLSKSAFCSGDVIFFTLENRFLGIESGMTIEQVGQRYGPIIATKPKENRSVYTDQFDMHTAKKTALVTFFTDSEKRILHYEVRDPDIYLVNGVHTGMLFEELRQRISDLSLKEESRYGMVTLESEQINLDFILTQDFDGKLQSIEDIDPKSRLYLIRY